MRVPSLGRIATAVLLLLVVPVAWGAQPKPDEEELGLTGYVLAPDGAPVSSGTVMLQSYGAEVSASIGRDGRFRLVPDAPGLHQIHVAVPGLAPYRVRVAIPFSKTLMLPAIRLSPATYFRVRFVSSAGEPITSPRIIRQSFDVRGIPVWEPAGARIAEQTEPDGATTLGPLPRGVTTLGVDAPPLARTRLPDVQVTGGKPLIDGGTVTIEPGAVLHVDVVDAAGAPVAAHEVSLEDVVPLSAVAFMPVRTDQRGRATFERVASGRYRLRTRAVGPCGDSWVSVARGISVAGRGTAHTRLVAGGSVTFRLTSSGVPWRATTISVSPAAAVSAPPRWLRAQPTLTPFVGRPIRPFASETACSGATDADGRITLRNFPPGPARIDVRLPNSTWVRQLDVPPGGREIAIEIPTGFLPLRVSNAASGAPVAGAAITWTSGGARAEATTSVNGEALLGGVVAAPGTLAIRSAGYEPAEVKLAEPPGVLHEIAIAPTRGATLQCRVISASGEPLPEAVVELTPDDPLEVGQVAVTDAKGSARFFDAPLGSLRLLARADGYVASRMRIPADTTSELVVTLSRGYRVIARVESPASAGPYLIRIVNDRGASMDNLLDTASDRRVEPPGRVSLGPLPPGTYIVELLGSREQRQERGRIDNRDVQVTFR